MTPMQRLDRLNMESDSVERLARSAMEELSEQARKTIGNPEPILEIWRVIDRTNRNLQQIQSIAKRERRSLPRKTTLAPPWKRGSKFGEVVGVCYGAAGYAEWPKTAWLAAQRHLKASEVARKGAARKT